MYPRHEPVCVRSAHQLEYADMLGGIGVSVSSQWAIVRKLDVENENEDENTTDIGFFNEFVINIVARYSSSYVPFEFSDGAFDIGSMYVPYI